MSDIVAMQTHHWPVDVNPVHTGAHPTGIRLDPADLLWVLIWNDKARFGITVLKSGSQHWESDPALC